MTRMIANGIDRLPPSAIRIHVTGMNLTMWFFIWWVLS